MLRKMHAFAFLTLIAVMFAGIFSVSAQAGENRIPLRTQKVKEGDWIFYVEDGEYFKETAKELEKLEDDYIVHYTMEKFDKKGKVTSSEDIARFLSDERTEMSEIASDKSAKLQKRRVKIEGKNVDVIVASYSGDIPYEMWYSADIGITGRVATVYKMPSEDDPDKTVEEKDFETLGFGNAKTQFNVRKYLK